MEPLLPEKDQVTKSKIGIDGIYWTGSFVDVVK